MVDEPDPAARPRRRSFTAEYKAEILDEYDALPVGSSERGALLRREGLYTLASRGVAQGPRRRRPATGWRRSAKAKRSAEQVELERLRRRNERLEAELAKTRSALEIMGKAARALGSSSPRARTPTRSRSRDRRALRRPRRGDVDQAGVRAARGVASDAAIGAAGHRCAGPPAPRPAPPNKLTEAERQQVLTVLRSAEYCDLAPAQVWARLLDDGIYLCSISTMYRLLAVAGENRERRRQRTHPARKKPELIATAPNQVWSLGHHQAAGPDRGVYYELFVIIDIFSRYVVGLDGVAGRDRRARRGVHRRHPRHATASTATSSPCTPTGAPR